MEGVLPSSAAPAAIWLDVGEPPATIAAEREQRARRIVPKIALISGVLFGGVSGYIATILWPGASSWGGTRELGLFLAVAIPVGIADYLSTRWFVPRIAAAETLHVRRLAVADRRVTLELADGKQVGYPTKRLVVGQTALAENWYTVVIPLGKFSLNFTVPELVAAQLRNAPR